MTKTLCAALAVAALLVLPACMKMETKNSFNADNTGTLSMKMMLKSEVLETIKAQMEAMGVEDDGKMDKLNETIDEKAMTERLKKQGVEVTSTKSVDKDGWKGFELEGKIADVNAFTEKAAKSAEEEAASATAEAGMGMDTSGFGKMALAFYKTEDPAVGSLQIMPPMGDLMGAMGADNPLSKLDEASEEELQMFEGMMEMLKTQFALDQMSMSIIVGIPGEITATKGCKKTEDGKGVAFTMSGGDMNLDNVKTMFGMKDGVSVDFKIPKDCKITFKDRPKKDAAPTTPKPEKKEEKKGGLKIGEGGGI